MFSTHMLTLEVFLYLIGCMSLICMSSLWSIPTSSRVGLFLAHPTSLLNSPGFCKTLKRDSCLYSVAELQARYWILQVNKEPNTWDKPWWNWSNTEERVVKGWEYVVQHALFNPSHCNRNKRTIKDAYKYIYPAKSFKGCKQRAMTIWAG